MVCPPETRGAHMSVSGTSSISVCRQRADPRVIPMSFTISATPVWAIAPWMPCSERDDVLAHLLCVFAQGNHRTEGATVGIGQPQDSVARPEELVHVPDHALHHSVRIERCRQLPPTSAIVAIWLACRWASS